jgi:hypothetical protein
MLPKRTCLLLGAGASTHLGFPLGQELRQKMLFELLGHKDKPHEVLHEDFRKGGEDLKLLFERFSFGNWNSPDAFLATHTEFLQTGKYLICYCLAQFEQPWGVTASEGWYKQLIQAIHVEDPHRLKDNQLSIVTFNYDRSIDFRLHKYIEQHFCLPTQKAWELLEQSIPIVHVHGSLGSYPRWQYGDTSNLWERGQEIKIVSELQDDTPEFQEASRLLNEAERVIVLGFGFNTDNVRRLRFFKYCVFDDREILIAAGFLPGVAAQAAQADWLQQWGLLPDQTVFAVNANDFCDQVCNPFLDARTSKGWRRQL